MAIVNPLTAMELAGAGLQVRPLSVSIPFAVTLVVPPILPLTVVPEPYQRARLLPAGSSIHRS